MDQSKIGRFVAELRKQHGWTQAQLGEQLGVTNKTISRWENGNYMPEISVIPELAAVLGVSVNELIAGERFAETEYKRGADEQLLKTMRLIEEIREIKDSRWLSQGFGSTALAIVFAEIFYMLFGSFWRNPNAELLVGGISVAAIFVMLAGVWGIMYLNKGRFLVFFGAVLLFYCCCVNDMGCLILLCVAIPLGFISVVGDRMYFKAIDALLENTPKQEITEVKDNQEPEI